MGFGLGYISGGLCLGSTFCCPHLCGAACAAKVSGAACAANVCHKSAVVDGFFAKACAYAVDLEGIMHGEAHESRMAVFRRVRGKGLDLSKETWTHHT